jgi:carbamoyl-phosphate synthase large subunit
VPIIGTSPDSIDLAEDRERFQKMIVKLGLLQPPNRTARTPRGAALAREIGYPLVVRPELRARRSRDGSGLFRRRSERYITDAVRVSNESPVLLDRFLDNAVEVDVDVVADSRGQCADRRHHGAHRGSRRAFRRQFVLAAAVFAVAIELQDELREQVRRWRGAQGHRPDEHAVRDPGRRTASSCWK